VGVILIVGIVYFFMMKSGPSGGEFGTAEKGPAYSDSAVTEKIDSENAVTASI
jgi:hypothetical protein